MKRKLLHPTLRNFVSKHFAQHLFSEIQQSIDVQSGESPLKFWEAQTVQFKMQSLCFVSPTLIDLVNQVNTKLLCTDLLKLKGQPKEQSGTTKCEKEYLLLNAFELLWDLDKQSLCPDDLASNCLLDSE